MAQLPRRDIQTTPKGVVLLFTGVCPCTDKLNPEFSSSLSAGTLIHVEDADGKDVATFAPSKTYQSLALASPLLVSGSTYRVYSGGSSSCTITDGLYEGGEYTVGACAVALWSAPSRRK